MPFPHSKKGFTLVEVLLIVLVIGLFGTIAVTNYINSTGTFNFISGYKSVMSSLQTARSYSLTNKQISDEMPERFGVEISEDSIIAFADDGLVDLTFEPEEDSIVKSFDFSETDYQISASDSDGNALAMPLKLFYKSGSGQVKIFETTNLGAQEVKKNEHRYVVLDFHTADESLRKYIVLFQVSGLPEEYNSLNDL